MPHKVILLEENQYLCPKCSHKLPYVKASDNNSEGWTEEHIIPLGLGNREFTMALCKSCNSGFSERFEGRFLAQPEVLLGQLRARNEGRRKRTSFDINLDARVLTRGKEGLHQVRIIEGVPKSHVKNLPTGSNDNFRSSTLPAELQDSDELSVISIGSDHISILEAIKISFEQIFWHLGKFANDLEIIQFMRYILDTTPNESTFDLFDSNSQRQIQSMNLLDFC